MADYFQIGDVAEHTGLSLRTIRYYDEVGLVPAIARTDGGYRLYTTTAVKRFEMIKRMKPLEFSLDQMRHVFYLLTRLDTVTTDTERHTLIAELTTIRATAQQRRDRLAAQLDAAEAFLTDLDTHITPTPAIR